MTTDPLDRARLAELDAGLPDETAAAQLRAQAVADPDSAAVLDALAATRAHLAGHRAPPVPPAVAQRWTAALAAAASEGAEPAVPRIERRRRWKPRPALVAAAVLVIAAVVIGILQSRSADVGLQVGRADLVATARAAIGAGGIGELADPAARAACLRSVAPTDPAPDAPLLGGRTVVYEGRPGVLLLLATGNLAGLRVVVVDNGCHALLADLIFER